MRVRCDQSTTRLAKCKWLLLWSSLQRSVLLMCKAQAGRVGLITIRQSKCQVSLVCNAADVNRFDVIYWSISFYPSVLKCQTQYNNKCSTQDTITVKPGGCTSTVFGRKHSWVQPINIFHSRNPDTAQHDIEKVTGARYSTLMVEGIRYQQGDLGWASIQAMTTFKESCQRKLANYTASWEQLLHNYKKENMYYERGAMLSFLKLDLCASLQNMTKS